MAKYTINLSDKLDITLEALATRQGVTKANIIRRAIGLLHYIANEQDRGNRIYIAHEGNLKEIVFESDFAEPGPPPPPQPTQSELTEAFE